MDDSAFEDALTRLVDHHPTVAELDALCDLYERATPAQRELLRGTVDVHDGTWQFPLAYISFHHPERHLPPARIIRDHLIGYCLGDVGPDWRDFVCALAFVYNTAESAGLDADALFRAAARMAEEPVARWILEMANRRPESRSRRAFCLVEATDGVGTYLKMSAP